MRIDYSHKFIKQFKKCSRPIQISFRNRLALFIKNRNDPVLRNHALTGYLIGFRSINITGDWRAIFRESKGKEVVIFEILGTHSQLYK